MLNECVKDPYEDQK